MVLCWLACLPHKSDGSCHWSENLPGMLAHLAASCQNDIVLVLASSVFLKGATPMKRFWCSIELLVCTLLEASGCRLL